MIDEQIAAEEAEELAVIKSGRALLPITAWTFEELRAQNREPVSAVRTMLPTWNKMCRDEGGGLGLAHGWHVVVGGKAGAGKSILGLNMAVEAGRHGEKAGFVSLEMSRRQLLTRALAINSGYSVRCLEPGAQYNDADYTAASEEWLDRIGPRFYVNSSPIQSLEDIKTEITRAFEVHGVRYFVVDYLQLAWVSRADSLNTQITEVSHTIRGLAQTHKLVSVGLSQYNRETSKAKDSPQSTGLMGGSSLENDADQVVLLDHTSYQKHATGNATQDVLLSKNRHGSVGKIAVTWDYDTLRIAERADVMPF